MSVAVTAAKNPRLRATLLLACLAQFMVILDVSVVNVALPSIRGALRFSEQDLQWVVNAYTAVGGLSRWSVSPAFPRRRALPGWWQKAFSRGRS